MLRRFSLVSLFFAASALPAFAHLDPVEHGSFAAGFSHPFFGADHVLAMVAVGLWAALLGGRSVWLVPVAFVGTMLIGFAAAMLGVGLPFVEPVIAASVVVIGLLAMIALQVPASAGMTMVGFFAFFHGYAHGGELGEAGAWPFSVGFAFATSLLHAVGMALGIGLAAMIGGAAGRTAARIAGGLTALAGLWLVAGA